jgi:beta-galactosidase/beta-glucuronidase
MADEGIFATTAEVQAKVGANASATANAEAYINQFMTEAESIINATCRYNFSDAYAALNVDVKGILKSIASNMAAYMVINYDTTGMSKRESENRLNVLRDSFMRDLSTLKEQKTETFMINA